MRRTVVEREYDDVGKCTKETTTEYDTDQLIDLLFPSRPKD